MRVSRKKLITGHNMEPLTKEEIRYILKALRWLPIPSVKKYRDRRLALVSKLNEGMKKEERRCQEIKR